MREGCALVTGGSRGIGAATAIALAREGWPVGVNYHSNGDAAAEVVEQIQAAGGKAVALQADISDPDGPDALLAELQERFGTVLVLVNNAGTSADALLTQIDDEAWAQTLDTNLSGSFRLIRRAIGPMMRARHGRVISIASVVGIRANPGQANYAASKAGLIGLTRTVAAEVARRKVTVNAVAPGLIQTEMTDNISNGLLEAVPARRAGTPEEVAACVRFLASEEASYVTGTTLTVDGGMTA